MIAFLHVQFSGLFLGSNASFLMSNVKQVPNYGGRVVQIKVFRVHFSNVFGGIEALTGTTLS